MQESQLVLPHCCTALPNLQRPILCPGSAIQLALNQSGEASNDTAGARMKHPVLGSYCYFVPSFWNYVRLFPHFVYMLSMMTGFIQIVLQHFGQCPRILKGPYPFSLLIFCVFLCTTNTFQFYKAVLSSITKTMVSKEAASLFFASLDDACKVHGLKSELYYRKNRKCCFIKKFDFFVSTTQTFIINYET